MMRMQRHLALSGLLLAVVGPPLVAKTPLVENSPVEVVVPTDSKATRTEQAETLKVDALKNCIFLGEEQLPDKKIVQLKLKPNRVYTVTASGAAFLSQHKGRKADPVPGVVLNYCTNEQDGFASQSRILKSGESVSFTTPKRQSKDLFLAAFFIDHWPKSKNQGEYELTIKNVTIDQARSEAEAKASRNILNLNFAHDPENGHFHGAIGSANDRWNFIDYSQQKLQGVQFADGSASDVEVNISENDGEWGIAEATGAYHGYIYHNCQCVDLSVSLKYLPTGLYEVYVFAHGDAPNQNAAIEIESGTTKLTGKSTLNDGTWNFHNDNYEDGNQYIRYVVEVESESPLTITSKRDGSNYSMFNAIQLKRIGVQ